MLNDSLSILLFLLSAMILTASKSDWVSGQIRVLLNCVEPTRSNQSDLIDATRGQKKLIFCSSPGPDPDPNRCDTYDRGKRKVKL